MSQELLATRVPQSPVREWLLWYAALGSSIGWALHLTLAYPLVEVACRMQSRTVLWILSGVLLAMIAGAGVVSWYCLRTVRPENGVTVRRRVRFMARAGLIASILFFLFSIAGTLPVVFDDPCQLQGHRAPTVFR